MRKHGRVDATQAPLVAYARALGCSWLSLADVGGGCPDGILGHSGRSWLIEFKTAKGTLTADQRAFMATWRGSPVQIIRTEAELETLLKRGKVA